MKSESWQTLATSGSFQWIRSCKLISIVACNYGYEISSLKTVAIVDCNDSRQSLSSLCELCLSQSPSLKLAGFTLHTVRALTLHVLLPEVAVLLREGLTVEGCSTLMLLKCSRSH
jgi:hypothetical protein